MERMFVCLVLIYFFDFFVFDDLNVNIFIYINIV